MNKPIHFTKIKESNIKKNYFRRLFLIKNAMPKWVTVTHQGNKRYTTSLIPHNNLALSEL